MKKTEEEPEEVEDEDYRKYRMDLKDCTLQFGAGCTVIINSGSPPAPPPPKGGG